MFARAAIGEAEDLDTSLAHLDHTEFIDSALVQMGRDILPDIVAQTARSVLLLPANEDSINQHVVWALALSFPDPPAQAEKLFCRVTHWNFSLVGNTRQRFAGRFWVQRELAVGLRLDQMSAVENKTTTPLVYDRTYASWVSVADLERFNRGEFADLEVPSSSGFAARWLAPVGAGIGLGFLAYLFFSVR